MRTTVTIDDHLLEEAKVIAARTHRSLGEVIDDGLRLMLIERDSGEARGPVVLPTSGGGGLVPGVDLEDRESMAEALGDNQPFDAAR